MQSLEHHLKKLDLSPPSQREDESKSAESSNENAPAAAESMSPLDLFIRDLDERKGKLPCCQDVTDIQTSVEKFVKALLLEVEKDLPFFKTTLVNSASFYEGTKVGKPDEFDYFVQLDNFSRSEDIRFEELPHCMVAVIPRESAFEKLSKVSCSVYSFDSWDDWNTKSLKMPEAVIPSESALGKRPKANFEWKTSVKLPFYVSLESKLVAGFKAFGLTVTSPPVIWGKFYGLRTNGPAYTLDLKWTGGKLYRGLKITVDLVLAVKINSQSSTMNIDFDSQAGSVVKSLLHPTLPYYFAVSGYQDYTVSLSTLFKEFEETQKHREEDFDDSVSITRQSDCLLCCSQSCLEQSLFRHHFGPDGGPSVCLRVLKVLRDMTCSLDLQCPCQATFDKNLSVDHNVWKFIKRDQEINNNWHTSARCSCTFIEPGSTKLLSSYTLKTLVLFEWSENPEEKQWTGSNLSQRLVNIVTALLRILMQNKGLRSFWYKDYNVLLHAKETYLPGAINRVTIILKYISSLRSQNGNYCLKDCVQSFENLLTMARRKKELARFLDSALQDNFCDKVKNVLREYIGMTVGKGLMWASFRIEPSVYSDIYIQAALEKIAPDEDLILTSHFECKNRVILMYGPQTVIEKAEEIVKNARDLFEEIARKRMNDLDNLPDYNLWSRGLKFDEVASLLKSLCENFEKDVDIFRIKIRMDKE